MKQIINQFILIIFLSLLGSLAFGQVRIGVSGGVNFTNGASDYPMVNKERIAMGFHAGLLSTLSLHKQVYLQAQLLYSLQGWSFVHNIKGPKMSLHYINLPVLIGYKPLSNFSLLVGPQLGRLLKAHLTDRDFVDIFATYRNLDIGIALGGKYHLTSELGLEVRYIHGLTYNVQQYVPDATGQSIIERDGHNRTLQVGISYLFGKQQGR